MELPDLDAIEARANAATEGPWGYRNAWRAADAEFIAHARTDVPALVALVRAKQSWIDGAKVDMAAMEEERAKALAAIALAGEEIERASVEVKRADRQRDDARAAIDAVRALHQPMRIYDECGHPHQEGDPHVIDTGEFLTCEEEYLYSICRTCCVRSPEWVEQSEDCASDHVHNEETPICSTVRIVARVEGDES